MTIKYLEDMTRTELMQEYNKCLNHLKLAAVNFEFEEQRILKERMNAIKIKLNEKNSILT